MLKKIFFILIISITSLLAANKTVVVDSVTGKIPTLEKFKQNNDIPSTKYPYIFLNMQPDTMSGNSNWIPYDAELKVIDSNNKLIYWVSTIQSSTYAPNYLNNPATDLNARIYFLCRKKGVNPSRPVWNRFNFEQSCIYAYIKNSDLFDTTSLNGGIGGILIIPNMSGQTVGGTNIKEIFDLTRKQSYKYSIIYLRISADKAETINKIINNVETNVRYWQQVTSFQTGAYLPED